MIIGPQINVVLKTVVGLSDDGNEQLGILTYALVAACKSVGIDKMTVLQHVGAAMDTAMDLVPLDSVEANMKKGMN